MYINYKLKGAIAESGMSVQRVSDATGLSRKAFWQKVAGQTEFKESEIRKVCEFLGKKPEEIFFSYQELPNREFATSTEGEESA